MFSFSASDGLFQGTDMAFSKPLETQQHVPQESSTTKQQFQIFEYPNVKSVVWCFSLESQRLTADAWFIRAAKLMQQEHLDCQRARHRTDINVIYFLTWFLPEIQMLTRWSLSPAGIYTTAEQEACYTINILARNRIRHIF